MPNECQHETHNIAKPKCTTYEHCQQNVLRCQNQHMASADPILIGPAQTAVWTNVHKHVTSSNARLYCGMITRKYRIQVGRECQRCSLHWQCHHSVHGDSAPTVSLVMTMRLGTPVGFRVANTSSDHFVFKSPLLEALHFETAGKKQ